MNDIEGAVSDEMKRIGAASRIRPGASVAITVGSRGINNILTITRAVVAELKSLGAEPFIIPAMGSHGGATPEGQKEVLAHYGITEEAVGCPIKSSMEVEEVGRSPDGIISYVDQNALAADHIVVMNRIKPHTEFEGKIESGLFKMMCIGLGKQKGAHHYHRAGVNFGFEHALRTGGRTVLENCRVVFGIGIVENGKDETAIIKALLPEEMEKGEEELLVKAKEWMPKLPFMEAEVLIVDEMGKNISGSGMDTKVIGRIMAPYSEEPQEPKILRVVVLRPTPESEGNCTGLGLADFCHKRLVDQMEQHPTYINCMTAQSPEKARIPAYYDTDRKVLDAAFSTIGLVEKEKARVMRIKNTLHLEEVDVSEAFLPEVEGRHDLELIGEAGLEFDAEDNLKPFE